MRRLKLVFEVHDMASGNAVVPKSQYVQEFTDNTEAWSGTNAEIAEACGSIVARSIGLQSGIAPRRTTRIFEHIEHARRLAADFESA